MTKFSVKKPYTVFVAVVAVLVLGAVAFMNMTPDLLPSIDLPYVVLMTTYPGATPERVETEVTKPLERSMATLENIESISSTSSENVSAIILEFTADVNMDTITVDILQKVSQIEGYWSDAVGTPIILKLNPDMLPVMVAAVGREGMDTTALSAFAQETLINQLEGISGVASVSATGLVDEKIHVVLNQEKINLQKLRINETIEAQFEEPEEELNEAKDEIESRLGEIGAAMAQLEEAKKALADGAATGAGEINKKEQELIDAKLKIYAQMEELEEQRVQLEQTEAVLAGLKQSIDQLEQAQTQLVSLQQTLASLQQELARLDALDAGFEQKFRDDGMSPEQIQDFKDTDPDYQQMMVDYAALDGALAALGTTRNELPAKIIETDAQLSTAQAGLAAIDATLASMGTSRAELGPALDEIAAGKQQLIAAIQTLEAMIPQLDAGTLAISAAMAELERQKTAGLIKLSDTTAQLVAGEVALQQALREVEQGLKELEAAKKAALDKADLEKIITLDTISNILLAQNFSMPAGYVTQDGLQVLVRVGDTIKSPDELKGLLLFDFGLEDVPGVYLSDVADVFVANNLDSVYAKINGTDGILLTFNKQSTYATAEVSDNIRQKFDELSAEYEGLQFESLMDQGDYIYIVVNSIVQNLLLGAVFAIIILYLFLKDLRPTFITLCSIPISVLFAIVLMYFSGVTINIISLSGLAVAVGMLVDNSVVVIENVYRLRGKGVSAVKAAVSGAVQVAGAIVASTLTTICVFLPIVFVEGITRQLFTDMALTIAYSLLASLVVALTLVPAMSAGLLRSAQQKENKTMDRLLRLYEKTARWTLRHKLPVLALSLALLVLSSVLTLSRGFSFMPSMDMPQLTVTLEMPEGTPLAETKTAADETVERIRAIEGVGTVGAMVADGGGQMGGGLLMGGSGSDTTVSIYVLLSEDTRRGGNDVIKEINETFENLDGFVGEVQATGASNMTDAMSALGGSGVSINLYGENADALHQAARQVAALLEGVEGTGEVDDGIGETDPEIRFIVDKKKAMEHGLTVAQVFQEINKALTADTTSTTVSYEGEDYDVMVVSAQEKYLTPYYIKNYSFTVTGLDGTEETVKLADIAQVVETQTANAIHRTDQRRLMTVSASLAEGHNVSLVTGAAEQAMQSITLPAGISYEFVGENTTIMDAMWDLLQMLLLGVLLVYLIMVAQFQSLKSPFIVMFTIPLAFTGGLLALLFTGREVSVIAMVGFVMLSGIIVNNGIVLVEYINQLRAEGVEKRQAIIEAGMTRMRPILMTSITTILGLSVMAVGVGTGAELMQPVAIVCIGGLTYATLLTLYVIPALYDLFNRGEMRMVDDAELEVTDE